MATSVVSLCIASSLLAVDALRIAPSDPSILYSPYGWAVSPTNATTANTGSYFRLLFTGATAALAFDTSQLVSPPSQIFWQIDDGPATPSAVLPLVNLSIPLSLQNNPDLPFHLLTITIKSMTETRNRWLAASPSTRVVFTGLLLDAAAIVALPFPAPRNILLYGDSITEGVRTLGESQQFDTDRNDATLCWSSRQGALLGAETGLVGFGASGLTRGGSGGVPALPVSFNLLWEGTPRTFSPLPDLVVLNEGTNDGSADTVSAMVSVLNGIMAACPGTPIAVLRPFNGVQQAANLQAAIAASSSPANCHYIDTSGFFNTSFGGDSMNLHPSGPNGVARIAPQVAARLLRLLLK